MNSFEPFHPATILVMLNTKPVSFRQAFSRNDLAQFRKYFVSPFFKG